MADAVSYIRLPIYMREGARLWVEDGIMTGSFMSAVMANDFVQAVIHADSGNLTALPYWARWLTNEAPPMCWGSQAKVDAWRAHRGQRNDKGERDAQD